MGIIGFTEIPFLFNNSIYIFVFHFLLLLLCFKQFLTINRKIKPDGETSTHWKYDEMQK